MSSHKLPLIEVGFQLYTEDGGEEFGAVRAVVPNGQPELDVYIENSGDFTIALDAVKAVHSGKVIVDVSKLDKKVRDAIAKAHRAENA